MCVGSNLALQGESILTVACLLTMQMADELSLETKLVAAAIYTNFRTSIVNDEGIEAIDAYTVHPTSEKLILKFDTV